jgi:hypothetical protein
LPERDIQKINAKETDASETDAQKVPQAYLQHVQQSVEEGYQYCSRLGALLKDCFKDRIY